MIVVAMDASSVESMITNPEADASHADDDVMATEQTETEGTYQASGETDCLTNATRTDNSEIDFKSPKHFAVPSFSLTTSKKRTEQSEHILTVTQKSALESSDETFNAESKSISSEVLTNQIIIPYKEPEWSGKAEGEYSFDVLKNGSIIETMSINKKPFYVFGRLPSCDVTLEHPSLSRYHAVVQYNTISISSRERGWYIYDMDSTHGTWVNKKKISPKVYHRLRVGHIVKFGGSSRLHILQGPAEDTDDESEMTVTEMKEQHERLRKETELLRQVELQEQIQRQEADKKLLEDRGCGWGIDEDTDEIAEENPYTSLVPENESLYIDDPKKALKGFYEREGCDLPDYQFTEVAMGKHKCRLDLPVDGPNGEELVAEVVVSGKRKDAVVACALEACRILDRFGLLRSASHESRKRKQKKWEDDDFYDSDEDPFLDRTGTIEKKRFIRMKNAGKSEVETYESLIGKYNIVAKQIQEIETKLQKAKEEAEARASEEMDELDAYMVSIKAGAMDTKTRIKLKGDLLRLKAEEQKLRKLVNIAKPPSLPPLQPSITIATPPSTATADSLSRKLHAQQKQLKKPTTVRMQTSVQVKPDNYEEQEEEEEMEEDDAKHKIQKFEKPKISSKSQDEASSCAKMLDRTREPICRPVAPDVVKGPSLTQTSEDSRGRKSRSLHQLSTAAVLNTLDKTQSGQRGKPPPDPNFDTSDPDYAMWLPPTEQSGDGRTSLNDKLGY